MNASQIRNLIIQNSKGLPADTLQEVLDFIQFLKWKKLGAMNDSIQTTLNTLSSSEEQHLDEEFFDYKTLYPKE
jgi:hypothetical protein